MIGGKIANKIIGAVRGGIKEGVKKRAHELTSAVVHHEYKKSAKSLWGLSKSGMSGTIGFGARNTYSLFARENSYGKLGVLADLSRVGFGTAFGAGALYGLASGSMDMIHDRSNVESISFGAYGSSSRSAIAMSRSGIKGSSLEESGLVQALHSS
jgi:hypothetical protein